MSTLRLAAHVKHFSRCFCANKDVYRTLLSDAYKCQSSWDQRLNDAFLSKVVFSDYMVKVHNKFEKNQSSFLDMDILANKVHEINDSEVELFESILEQFRMTENGRQISSSIKHAIVRGYIAIDLTDRLLVMIKDKIKYGLQLDFISANILMDYFIKKNKYLEASRVAFEMMLQEDFENKTTFLLSLYATTKLLYHPVVTETKDSKQPTAEDEEEVWERVKIVEFPFYDDHFSIQSQTFLHGKTLYMLGKLLGGVEGRSLQFVGLGMYEKFPRALNLLKDWLAQTDGELIVKDTVTQFDELLQNAATRNPDEPEKDFGLLRIEDEIHKLKLTPSEKEQCIADWQELKKRLQNENRLSSINLEEKISEHVKNTIPAHEDVDIKKLKLDIELWRTNRRSEFDREIKEYQRRQKQQEIQEKLIEMQAKEELFAYYKHQNEIKLAMRIAPEPYPEPPKKKELTEDEETELKPKQKQKAKK